MTITITFIWGQQVRRAFVALCDATNIRLLHDLATKLFPVADNQSVEISWIDDNDNTVIVSSDDELRKAIEAMITCDIYSSPTFQVEVKDSESLCCSKCKAPLSRIQFRCSKRDNFNLCQNCEESSAPHPYPMIMLSCQTHISFSISFRHEEKVSQSQQLHNDTSSRMVHRDSCCSMCNCRPICGCKYVCLLGRNVTMCEGCERKRRVKSPVLKIYSADQLQDGFIDISYHAHGWGPSVDSDMPQLSRVLERSQPHSQHPIHADSPPPLHEQGAGVPGNPPVSYSIPPYQHYDLLEGSEADCGYVSWLGLFSDRTCRVQREAPYFDSDDLSPGYTNEEERCHLSHPSIAHSFNGVVAGEGLRQGAAGHADSWRGADTRTSSMEHCSDVEYLNGKVIAVLKSMMM